MEILKEAREELEQKLDVEQLELLQWPNIKGSGGILHVVESEIPDLTDLIKNMYYTMSLSNAVAISAPQVGVFKKIIVLNISEKVVMFNPQILYSSPEKFESDEGILAIPGYFYKCMRSKAIKIGYIDENGEQKLAELEGYDALAVQHHLEILNNRTFVDDLPVIKRFLTVKKINKHMRRLKK